MVCTPRRASTLYCSKYAANAPSPRFRMTSSTRCMVESMRGADVSGKYDYVHLISANDIPLMTVQYFISFLKKNISKFLSDNQIMMKILNIV